MLEPVAEVVLAARKSFWATFFLSGRSIKHYFRLPKEMRESHGNYLPFQLHNVPKNCLIKLSLTSCDSDSDDDFHPNFPYLRTSNNLISFLNLVINNNCLMKILNILFIAWARFCISKFKPAFLDCREKKCIGNHFVQSRGSRISYS